MGATIDYAILLTSSYREWRLRFERREALQRAMQASIGTIMTSSSILIFVTYAIGLTSADVTISEVCMTIAKGSLSSVLLVLFLLPGVLSALDRLVAGPDAVRKTEDRVPPTPPAGARSYALPRQVLGATALEEPATSAKHADGGEGNGGAGEGAAEDGADPAGAAAGAHAVGRAGEATGDTPAGAGDGEGESPSKEEEFDRWFDDFYRSYTEARGGANRAAGTKDSEDSEDPEGSGRQ